MSDSLSKPPCDEKTLVTVLIERNWMSLGDIDSARVGMGVSGHAGPLEQYLLDSELINSAQYKALVEICALPDTIAGFKILSTIGAGAMGIVYLAEEGEGGEKIALKVINAKHCDDPNFIHRFYRETKAVTELDHPHIAKALGSGKYKDQLYLAMEFIDGPSLSELIAEHGPIAEPYALRCILQIAQGLAHAFSQNALVHRDIKPANILIRRDSNKKADANGKKNLNLYMDQDSAQIIDFGLAKETGGDDDLTMTGVTMGTPHYMAPEQIKGDSDIDQRVDIYALGTTLFHLLTGEPPYNGNSPGAIMLAHINEPIPDPRRLIPSIKDSTIAILNSCLAKEKEHRFTTHKALVRALESALQGNGAGGIDGGSDRLLRKPLKLNKKTQAFRNKHKDRNTNSPSSSHLSNAETMELPSSSWNNPDPQDHASDTQSDSSRKYLPAESALRRIQTERIRKNSTRRINKTRVPTNRFTADKSAVFDENPIDDLGTSKLPWIILLVAVTLLALGFSSRYL